MEREREIEKEVGYGELESKGQRRGGEVGTGDQSSSEWTVEQCKGHEEVTPEAC